jgi:PIN domain nuclease of toxin-antitoxin system
VRLLLDTHIVLWQLSGERALSGRALEAVTNADELLFSVVSFAEIGVKAAAGKLAIPSGFRQHVIDSGVQILPLDADHGLAVANLPMLHRDPFDRLLVVQAQQARLTLVTGDRRLSSYDVSTILAA